LKLLVGCLLAAVQETF